MTGIGNKEIVMAKSKKQCRNEKGDGTFRQRPNGTFEYRIVYVDEYGKTKRKHFMGRGCFMY